MDVILHDGTDIGLHVKLDTNSVSVSLVSYVPPEYRELLEKARQREATDFWHAESTSVKHEALNDSPTAPIAPSSSLRIPSTFRQFFPTVLLPFGCPSFHSPTFALTLDVTSGNRRGFVLSKCQR